MSTVTLKAKILVKRKTEAELTPAGALLQNEIAVSSDTNKLLVGNEAAVPTEIGGTGGGGPFAISDITGLSTVLASEASARGAADTTLQTNIDAEATARASADATLSSSVSTVASAVLGEASTRAAADIVLQGNIDAEATTRAAADAALAVDISGKQAALGFTAENVANKSTSTSLGTSNTAYPSQNAVKTYVDAEATARASADTTLQTNINAKQDSLGFTAENVANKDTSGTLASNSDTKYPSQKAVKTYVDAEATARASADTTLQTNINAKQDSLGFTAENVANKDTSGTLASNSDTKYPSQKAVKTYVDAEATARASADTTLQTNIDAKAPLASPALTGTPTAPTAAAATNTTQIATCAFVESEIPLRSAVLSVAGRTGAITLAESDITGLVADLALKAPLASPTLTTPSINGAITMNGATSGSATLTAPAVAGTATNPFLMSNSLQLPSGTGIGFNADVGISRASAGSLNLGNGTPGNSTGTLILQTITASGSITAGAATSFILSGRSKLNSSADGLATLQNNAGTGFTGLNLGGNTSSFPRLARSGTAMMQTLGDGTAGGSFGAGGMTPVGIGTPTQIFNTANTGQTASIGATTMFTVGAADANFIAHFYLGQLNAGTGCSGAGSVGINVTFTDPITGNAYTVVVPIKTSGGTAFGTSLALTNGSPAVANTGSAELRIRAKAATVIQFSTTYAAGASCSVGQAYNIYPDLEAL
jgi:disulfide oxidoreductase YuzD